uniref:C-type lectin domain-containing protein n=1 Tax=Periophthalmus magnuspinnatus TaxID=409849 RepID=A0A3B3Z745_9GOBI
MFFILLSTLLLFCCIPPPTPAPGSGKCLHGFEPYGRYCYFVYNGPKGYSWPDSRHYCQAIKGDLVSLHSRADVEFVRNLNYTKEHNIWIGLTRDQNFGWAWTDKTSVGFFNWAQNEPNDAFHPGEVCRFSFVVKHGHLQERLASQTLFYIILF